MADKINLRISLVTSILLLVTLCAAAVGKIIYVDDDAIGANGGTSWADAYNFLQDALADANVAEKPVEIQVAQGTYRPNQGLMAIPEFDWRTTTFQLINGVMLKGGYGGFGEPHPDIRNIETYETILSGDLDGDDVEVADPCDLLGEPTRAENSYHVVTGNGVDATAVLDGFNITAGNANGPESADPNSNGAGLYNFQSSPTVINCVFTGNSARWSGAGMHNICSSPVVINCTFNKNSAGTSSGGHGGGMSNNSGSNPILTNCKFSSNWAGQGGGINALCCAPIANSCKFMDNSANFGGGVQYKDSIGPKFFGCTFSGNSAHEGAAARFIKSSPILNNCKFVGNSASCGGGMYNWDSNLTLNNCTFRGNFADEVGGIFASWDRSSILTNCILWGNTFPQIAGYTAVSYTDVQGGWEGQGNIDEDPLFADPGYWGDGNDPNIVVEPNDPNAVWVDGDYHLKSQAGRWDPNSESWVQDDVTSPCIDAGDPNSSVGDEPMPNGGIINMGAYGGTSKASMSLSDVYIQWLGHASVKIWTTDAVIYVDPRNLSESPHDATLVLVTHSHGDHYQPGDIAKVSGPETELIASADVIASEGRGQAIMPGQIIESNGVRVTGVAAYNINKSNHPKSRNWVGFIVELAGRRIYVAGDTDLIPEMQTLGKIDVAFLPAGGTYTMNATEAAQAANIINPTLAIPYHWGQNVGTLSDAQTFAQKAACAVKIMTVGETISSDNWPKYSPLIAHWKLDEAEGSIAYDSSGNNDGILNGNPLWQPAGGQVDGALAFDGTDDYVSTNSVLNPADRPFSVFAWIKGGAPGQAVISQTGGANWLCADASDGKLMTELRAVGRVSFPLISQTVVTDGEWHQVGFTWDSSNRILYVGDVEVAKDTQAQLSSSAGGLYIGAGKNLEPVSFFFGLIDDIRIYKQPMSPEDIRNESRDR